MSRHSGLMLALGLAGGAFRAGTSSAAPAAAPAATATAEAQRLATATAHYQRLLDDFLHVVSRPGEPLATRVDYAGVHRPPNAERLRAVRRELLAAAPSRLEARARLAWAIDTYNLLVIDAIARSWPPPAASAPGGVLQMKLDGKPFFEAPIATVEGRAYSLDAFERAFVLADFDRKTGGAPPPALDPRAHFALVCGAKGCPPLRPRAYTPDSLDAQLDVATRDALASPAHLRLDPASGRLEASSIFDWYAEDFGGAPRAFRFLHHHAPEPVRREIDQRRLARLDGYLPWDWSFNDWHARDL